MAFDLENAKHAVTFGVVMEQNAEETVRCEERDGEVFFVFWTGSGDRRVVVPADPYLEALAELRMHPVSYKEELREALHGRRA